MRLAMRRIIVFVIWWHLTLPLASQSAWQQRFLNEAVQPGQTCQSKKAKNGSFTAKTTPLTLLVAK